VADGILFWDDPDNGYTATIFHRAQVLIVPGWFTFVWSQDFD
jgi:hypothetical protein